MITDKMVDEAMERIEAILGDAMTPAARMFIRYRVDMTAQKAYLAGFNRASDIAFGRDEKIGEPS